MAQEVSRELGDAQFVAINNEVTVRRMAREQQQPGQRPRLTLGTRILIGVLAGIGAGVFLGEWSSPLQVVGDIYVGLLQMTVLPYIVVSLTLSYSTKIVDGL